MSYPLETLRTILQEQRTSGVPFSEAWNRATEKVLDDQSGIDWRDWDYVFERTRDVWQDAYLGEGDRPAGIGAVTLNLDVE